MPRRNGVDSSTLAQRSRSGFGTLDLDAVGQAKPAPTLSNLDVAGLCEDAAELIRDVNNLQRIIRRKAVATVMGWAKLDAEACQRFMTGHPEVVPFIEAFKSTKGITYLTFSDVFSGNENKGLGGLWSPERHEALKLASGALFTVFSGKEVVENIENSRAIYGESL